LELKDEHLPLREDMVRKGPMKDGGHVVRVVGMLTSLGPLQKFDLRDREIQTDGQERERDEAPYLDGHVADDATG
jgi:hypothetical protein